MLSNQSPFNIKLLFLTRQQINSMGEVKSLSIFKPSTKDFDDEGLFSSVIFGMVGTDERNQTFGYIKLNTKILHPTLYKHIITLKSLYKDIFAGIRYAKWDKKEKDFVPSNMEEGSTGYEFFLSHYDEIKYTETESAKRKFKIELLKKYKLEESLLEHFLVLPAGLRDYTVDDAGKPSEDEVNLIYRRLMILVNTLTNFDVKSKDIATIDAVRYKIQTVMVELYDHFISLMDGKKKFILGKWAKRGIRDSTRNVITPLPMKILDLEDKERSISFNSTVIGLYQYIKGVSPIVRYNLKTHIINKIIDPYGTKGHLIDKKTLKTVTVEIKQKERDIWTSDEGLVNVFNKMAQEEFLSEEVTIDKYYLLLVYDDGKNIRMVYNTNDVPDHIDKKKFRPITYAELLYLAIYEVSDKYPGFLTRFPVAGTGGIYPSYPYLKTTVNGRIVNVLGDDWEVEHIAKEYPKLGESFVASLSPHTAHLDKLEGDYDGDKVSFTIATSDDSIKEINKLLSSKSYYIAPTGGVTYSVSNTVLDTLAKTLTF